MPRSRYASGGGLAMEDFIFVVLTLVLFALLALVVRAVEKL
jgi:hypothetical protein